MSAFAGVMFLVITILASLVGLDFAVGKVYETRFKGTTWDDEHWRVTTTNLDQGHYQSRMSLANGYLGINLAAVGPFFEVDTPVNGDMIGGWPLFNRRQSFATIGGFYNSQPTTNGTNFGWLYQYGGESVISGVPHWSGIHVQVGDEVLDASVPAEQISNFESTLDIRHATMTWSYTWTPSGGSGIDLEYTMFVNKLYVNQAAVQLKMTAESDTEAIVVDVLDGDCAQRTTFVGKQYEENDPVIWTAVSPSGFESVEAYIYSSMIGDNSFDTSSRMQYTQKSVIGANSSSIAQAMTVSLSAGKTSTVRKYIGGASSDAFDDPQAAALDAMETAVRKGYASVYARHCAEWQSIMTPDSVDYYSDPETGLLPKDPNVVELAIGAVTNPFHLLQNTIGARAIAAADGNTRLNINSIPVGGLGSDAYAGWIFWDAEIWMAPGLVVAFPDAAKQIAKYRVDKFEQAQRNIKTAYQSSKNDTSFSSNSAVFPWISGRFGNCTAAGPCFDYEYHLNGDIGLEFLNYYVVTGDTDFFETKLFPIYEAVAQLFADVVDYNRTTEKYELYNATDPDEYANFQDNVGFTMVLMHTHLAETNVLRARFDMPENETWAEISEDMTIPVDEDAGIILEYAAMNGSVEVKQADVVLIDDFLDYPNPYSLADLDYYAGKQSPNGPGMTYGVFSIVANEISPSGCSSYTYDLYSSQPYTRGPWFQFSEQLLDDYTANGGTHPAYPFLTGIGGSNRVAVFGYLGLRLMLDSLNVDPSLPPQIPHLDYRTIYWQGWPVDASSNQTHTTLRRLSKSLDNANSTFADSAIPVTIGIDGQNLSGDSKVYHLRPKGTITIPNRQIGNIKTVPGNIAQCRPVSSDHKVVPGQFPLSAVDGATSTKWQPVKLNVESSLTVELAEPFMPVTGLAFDWAQAPPHSYSVTFSNSSDGSDAVQVASDDSVQVSTPYVVADAAKIVPYASNTTNVTLDNPIYSGRYATLTIMGNRALEGTADERNGTGASVAEFAVVAGDGSDIAARRSAGA
ncbi:alpha,alpha-trehalase ath1 [Vermiconidia calcicola]|uniref:Alpha,alpha-trehalase ath1 n=1 Tax=Vermiconidia calcicola TaxID=1690605 RepID=A0ACC3NWR2_9PEZI|nr:alpha,alpha-trehalase ath1 [Vermiconidia calcicola]